MKNIIIVGTGRSILQNKYGKKIDDFDIVYKSIRTLMHPGYEEYVGTKASVIWLIDRFIGDLLYVRNFTGNVFVLSKDHELYEESYQQYNRCDYMFPALYRNSCITMAKKFNTFLKIDYFSQKKFLAMCAKLLFTDIYIEGRRSVVPTAGFTVLYYLVEICKLKNICVTGFDFFKTNNYFDAPEVKPLITVHKMWIEKLYYNKLLKEGIIYELR